VTDVFVTFSADLEFFQQIFAEAPNIKFGGNPSSGIPADRAYMRTDGRTDENKEDNRRFS
jgi:hypothetical protein